MCHYFPFFFTFQYPCCHCSHCIATQPKDHRQYRLAVKTNKLKYLIYHYRKPWQITGIFKQAKKYEIQARTGMPAMGCIDHFPIKAATRLLFAASMVTTSATILSTILSLSMFRI